MNRCEFTDKTLALSSNLMNFMDNPLIIWTKHIWLSSLKGQT